MTSIVAIHGLSADPARTWVCPRTQANWLIDFLPRWRRDLRILAINHDTTWDVDSPIKSLRDYGEGILESIASQRTTEEVK